MEPNESSLLVARGVEDRQTTVRAQSDARTGLRI